MRHRSGFLLFSLATSLLLVQAAQLPAGLADLAAPASWGAAGLALWLALLLAPFAAGADSGDWRVSLAPAGILVLGGALLADAAQQAQATGAHLADQDARLFPVLAFGALALAHTWVSLAGFAWSRRWIEAPPGADGRTRRPLALLLTCTGLPLLLALPLSATLLGSCGARGALLLAAGMGLAALCLLGRGATTGAPLAPAANGRGEEGQGGPAAPAESPRLRGAVAGTWRQMLSRRGFLGVAVLQGFFWMLLAGLGVCLLRQVQGQAAGLGPAAQGNEQALFCALGWVLGLLAAGCLSRDLSPLLLYPLAWTLVACGSSLLEDLWGGRQPWGAPNAGLGPAAALLGLGGGLLSGRLTEDLGGLAPAGRRGAFACGCSALAFTLAGIGLAWTRSEAALQNLLPGLRHWGIPIAVAAGWLVDAGLFAQAREIPRGLQERISYRLARSLLWISCKLYFRFSSSGGEKVPARGPVILAANHGSFFDPFFLGIGVPRRVQYLMHASYYRSLGHPFFRLMMTVPVDDSTSLRALKTLSHSLEQYQSCVGVFPEGHVSEDGKLQRPQSGVIFLAKRTGAQVVPIAICGNVAAFPRWARFPRPRKIALRVGEPFSVPKDATKQQVAEYTDRLMAAIAGLLGEPPPPRIAEEGAGAEGAQAHTGGQPDG